ncbi:TetR/AcrR family transcriptional regulator [Streptacidiphilus monticola]|uniref:TetR/AcrR family transcriptional regulator n=1 Tax=Streptacidiphilus monticola TaxID=2161674 RepID=A0ABW1GB69_9ACTN
MAMEREQVLTAAVGLLTRQPSAAMDEIARAAGISRATLHRMFPGREALIGEIAAFALRRMDAAVDAARIESGDPVAAVRRLAERMIPEAQLVAFLSGESRLFDDDEITRAWDEIDARVGALFLRGQQQGLLRVELPAGWLSEAFFSLLAGVGWAVQDGRLAARDSTRALTELFLGGVVRSDVTAAHTPGPAAPDSAATPTTHRNDLP